MWRILVSLVTVIVSAVAARLYSRPAPPGSVAPMASSAPGATPRGPEHGGAAESPDRRDDRITRAGPPVPRPGDPPHPGWNRARPDKIPRPTYWPVVLALGIALSLWGAITTVFLWVPGLLLLIVGATGWIRELLHESE